jgi:hypothetical protein
VKQIIMSTATDLHVRTNEQGVSMINSYQAVLAAKAANPSEQLDLLVFGLAASIGCRPDL